MKRLMGLFLLVSMVLAVMPAMAEEVFCGNMEVVNCNEWVSLREAPKTSAKRLEKVPLGAVVTQCRQAGTGWIQAVYNEKQGYIQDKYLQVLEGVDVHSAMLVANCLTGTDFYGRIGDLEPEGFIRTDTVVRNCAVLASGRACVEYGVRDIYVDAEHVVPYNELLHYPRQIVVRTGLTASEYEGPVPTLRVAAAESFPLTEGAYSEYDYTEDEPVDADTPKVQFVLHSDTAVKNLHLFSASLRFVDIEIGENVYDFTLAHIQPRLEAGEPLHVTAVIYGDTPNLAVGYEDWTGAYHFAFVEISGEDGSLLLREF